jgi:ribosomal protein S27E
VWNTDYKIVQHLRDNNVTTILDSTIYGNNGTKLGTTLPVEIAGIIGNGQYFDGATSYIDLGNDSSLIIPNTITISAWIKPLVSTASSTEYGRYISKSGSYYLGQQIQDETNIRWETDADVTSQIVNSGTGKVQGNNWNYIVVTYDKDAGANNKKVYVNGTLAGQGTETGAIRNVALRQLMFGRLGRDSIGGNIQYFNGTLDEVRISATALSITEINKSYQNVVGTAGFGNLGSVETFCIENLTNSSPIFVANLSCLSSDLLNQSWNYTTYDINVCGGDNVTTTFYSQNVSCNYCSYSVVNSTGSWSNISCVLGDLMNQTRNVTEYDENYDVCYAVTNLSSDLWNSGSNNTYIQYQLNGSCDWCVSDLTNTSWSNWSNEVCLNTGFWQQLRTLVQYDLNNCSDYSNFTYSDYTSNSSNCTSGSVGVGGEINFAPMLIIFILALFSFTLGIILKQPIILLVAGVLFVVLSAMGFSSYGALLGIVFLVFTLLSVVFGLILAWS